MSQGIEPPEQSEWQSNRHDGSAIRMLLWLCVFAAIGFTVYSAVGLRGAKENKEASDAATVHAMGLIDPSPRHLAGTFSDSQGRLLADPPASGQFSDPQTLVVAHLAASDADDPVISWPKFEEHLASVTGRQVTDEIYDNSSDQMSEFKDGKITVLALHAADTPFIVNNFGFQPIAILGDGGAVNGNRLDIIVKPDSDITRPTDLRDHALVCTVPSSITGYRAAVALLLQNEGLRPNVDYTIIWSLGQKRSITGVAEKTYEAAAVSDDKLQSLLALGDVAPSDFRMIYQSEVIPRTTIGYFYNLKPELAAQINQAVLSYEPESIEVPSKHRQKETAAAKPLRFIGIDYKKDFQLVRQIDDRFDPRLDAKTKSVKPATTEPTKEDATALNLPSF
jgi:phosphonate transport system substrate-binding protein